jgi:adenylate cyclase
MPNSPKSSFSFFKNILTPFLKLFEIGQVTLKIKINLLIGVVLTIFSTTVMVFQWSPLETLEQKSYDWHLKIRGPQKPPSEIVIAAIDEKSVEKIGRWPWSRVRLAELIQWLSQAGAELIVLDIILSEKDPNDSLLGKAIQESGIVLAPINFDCSPGEKIPRETQIPLEAAFQKINHPERFNRFSPFRARKVTFPVPEVLLEAMAIGHINMFADMDGTVRWEGLAVEYDGYLFPSIDLRAAAIFLGIPSEKMIIEATERVLLGNKRSIPTDPYGQMLIHYYGPKETFKHIPISDILEGTVNPKSLLGKIVLVGATSPGISDLRVTPFSADMAGIEKHANVIGTLLENKSPRRAAFSTNLLILLSSALFSILLIIRLKASGAAITALVSVILILSSGFFSLNTWRVWINTIYPSLNLVMIFFAGMAYNYATEERYARRIRAMFSSYVTERVVNELIKNPNLARLGGSRREVTILFSDVRGFTTFSEKNAPEQVVSILNEYLEAMTEVIFHWEGTLDKFIGDAIVAFWGAPLQQPDHAPRAVCCSLHMIQRLKELQQKWAAEGKPVLDCGIGINTGEVLVGNIGAEGKKMDYTVIGDHVNLCARIESLTRKYECSILISEFTLNPIKEAITASSLGHFSAVGKGRVIVKGKKLPVGIYEIKSLEENQACFLEECAEDQITQFSEK